MRAFLINFTDRYLFQKKESFKVVLNRLSEAIITILDLDQVGKKILETLRESLRLESGAILLRDEEEQGFYILDSYQIQRKEPKYGKDDFLFYYLAKYGGMVNLEDEGAKNRLPAMLLGRLEELNARLCIPLFLHQDLNGVLTLGKKKSDEEFTQEELDYLPAVAGQVAIALSNARLVEIVKKSQIDFAQQAKMAAIGTLAAGIGHEIKNPLQIIKSGIGMLKFNKEHGVYHPLTKEQFEAEVFEVIDKIRAAIERAAAVIDRLSGFARKPKELKLEEIHVEHAVEGALDFVRNEFENFQIEVNKNYASDLPPILVDSHAVEEVLLNILVNARHAIQERGTVTLTTRSHGPEVEVAVQDTGPGIAPESLDKIFDPFFTTKDTTRNSDPSTIKGTGLGLFIVRETVKKFGGRITVESETGKGTTFRIYFPAAEGSGAQDRILRSPLPREAEGEGLGEGA